MKKIITNMVVTDISWAEKVELDGSSYSFIDVRLVDGAFSDPKEVDEFCKLVKDMIKGIR